MSLVVLRMVYVLFFKFSQCIFRFVELIFQYKQLLLNVFEKNTYLYFLKI